MMFRKTGGVLTCATCAPIPWTRRVSNRCSKQPIGRRVMGALNPRFTVFVGEARRGSGVLAEAYRLITPAAF